MSYIKNGLIYKAESNPGAGEPSYWGESAVSYEIGLEGGLLYLNPAANLVGEEREEWLFE